MVENHECLALLQMDKTCGPDSLFTMSRVLALLDLVMKVDLLKAIFHWLWENLWWPKPNNATQKLMNKCTSGHSLIYNGFPKLFQIRD